MSKCEPARFHSAGSKSFFIASGSNWPLCDHASLASEAHSCIERVMSSPSAFASGGGSPCNAEGGGIPSAHAWKRLFWFSFQNFSHSLPCSAALISALPSRYGNILNHEGHEGHDS